MLPGGRGVESSPALQAVSPAAAPNGIRKNTNWIDRA
jgi:hypothetical protein